MVPFAHRRQRGAGCNLTRVRNRRFERRGRPSAVQAAGRKVQARSYDAMIAATAIASELPLYTVNPADFSGIEGLDLRPVPHPDQTLPPRVTAP